MVDGEAGDVHFLWVGGSVGNAPELDAWMKHDINVLEAADRITVVDSVETPSHTFWADAFVLHIARRCLSECRTPSNERGTADRPRSSDPAAAPRQSPTDAVWRCPT